jgi:hypothetical protein
MFTYFYSYFSLPVITISPVINQATRILAEEDEEE